MSECREPRPLCWAKAPPWPLCQTAPTARWLEFSCSLPLSLSLALSVLDLCVCLEEADDSVCLPGFGMARIARSSFRTELEDLPRGGTGTPSTPRRTEPGLQLRCLKSPKACDSVAVPWAYGIRVADAVVSHLGNRFLKRTGRGPTGLRSRRCCRVTCLERSTIEATHTASRLVMLSERWRCPVTS